MRYILLLLILISSCSTEQTIMRKLTITSRAFENEGAIPDRYTCNGENINPPINIKNIPDETESIVLIVDDPDASMGTWVHWVVWNIPPAEEIPEDMIPGDQGINSFKKHEYGGPCPPTGEHRYFFKLYALDSSLALDPDAGVQEVMSAMQGHILAQGELMGRYRR